MSSQLTPQDTLREVPVAGRTYLVYDPIPSLLAEERQRTVEELAQRQAAQELHEQREPIDTQAVIDDLFRVKDVLSPPPGMNGEVPEKESRATWEKKFARIAHEISFLTDDRDTYLNYLAQFKGKTGRHKRNEFDALNMLIKHAVRFFGMKRNPIDGLRPKVDQEPVQTLDLSQVATLNEAPEDLREKVSLHMLLHHGWRPIEERRITAGDVRRAQDDIILCRGKGATEPICIIPESLTLLREITLDSLRDDQVVLRSRRIRNGGSEPLGEDGLRDLTYRLFGRAGLEVKPYDLRRTFGTLFREASKDYELTERIMRHKLPGSGSRYIKWPMAELSQALQTYSPLRLIQRGEFDSPPSPP